MAKNNQKNKPKGLDDVNYNEVSGSPNPWPGDADAVIDRKADAVSRNSQKKAQPDRFNP